MAPGESSRNLYLSTVVISVFTIRRFKIGVFSKSGDLDAHPGCVRVVRETAELLKKKGHDVVEVSRTQQG